jgi:hypothetical protein
MSDQPGSPSELRVLASALDATEAPGSGPTHTDHIDLLDNVLSDTSTPAKTRRWLLKRAVAGTAAAGALGLIDPVGAAFAASGGNDVKTIGTAAVTAEAFAVTYLGAVLEKTKGAAVPPTIANVIKAAQFEEFKHYEFLLKAGFKPLTKTFYLEDRLFAGGVKGIAATIEVAETLFINAYLIGITAFAKAGSPTVARYAGEILGVEAEHRALARFAQGDRVPNNKSFETYRYTNIGDIVAQLEKAGVGFGKPTSRDRKSDPAYHFHGIGNDSAGLRITDNKPR